MTAQGVRGIDRDGPRPLAAEPNEIVDTINPDTMPVILATLKRIETWRRPVEYEARSYGTNLLKVEMVFSGGGADVARRCANGSIPARASWWHSRWRHSPPRGRSRCRLTDEDPTPSHGFAVKRVSA